MQSSGIQVEEGSQATAAISQQAGPPVTSSVATSMAAKSVSDQPPASQQHAGVEGTDSPAVTNATLTEPQVCSFFVRTGTCAYGSRCKFVHPNDCPPPVLNSRGYPLRASEPDCAHYRKKGWCAFGMTCKFNHPEILLHPAAVSTTLGPLRVAGAQPGSVLIAPHTAGSTTIVQGIHGGQQLVHTTTGSGPASFQPATTVTTAEVLQAPGNGQQPTTLYYLPAASGAFMPSVVQPYALGEASNSSNLNMVTPLTESTLPGTTTTVYSSTGQPLQVYTSADGQLFTAPQFVDARGVMGPSLVVQQAAPQQVIVRGQGSSSSGGPAPLNATGGTFHAHPAAGQTTELQTQLQGGNTSGLRLGQIGMPELPSVTYIQELDAAGIAEFSSKQRASVPTMQQLPTSYIQNLPALSNQYQFQSGLNQPGGLATMVFSRGSNDLGSTNQAQQHIYTVGDAGAASLAGFGGGFIAGGQVNVGNQQLLTGMSGAATGSVGTSGEMVVGGGWQAAPSRVGQPTIPERTRQEQLVQAMQNLRMSGMGGQQQQH